MKFVLLTMAILLSGCTATAPLLDKEYKSNISDRGEYKVDLSHSAQGQNERVQFLVFHYTALDDEKSLRILTEQGVSAHYLTPSAPQVEAGKPVVLQLVAEDKRAWHAGVSNWETRSNLNDTSIGIEIVNPGFIEQADGRYWYPYSPAQIDLIARMAKDIIDRYKLTPNHILAHSDIAPLRKYDPGPLFPWEQLAAQGIGAWPDPETVEKYLSGRQLTDPAPIASIQTALTKYGYRVPQTGILDDDTRKVISAFQMHFRPSNISGDPDAQTEAIALALVEKYKSE